VFPACENEHIDPTKPQKRAGDEASKLVAQAGKDVDEARRRAAEPFRGFRFHDLRHQAITEMAEAGASDATIMAVAGHLDRAMMEHYSHVRMAVKRDALGKLESG
jgi:integrase